MDNRLLRILIVDDDEILVELFQEYLLASDYSERLEFGNAFDGQDAISRLYSEHWDLVLLDLSMPKLGGIEVLRELRLGRSMNRNCPCIVMSSDIFKMDNIHDELVLKNVVSREKPVSKKDLQADVSSQLRL